MTHTEISKATLNTQDFEEFASLIKNGTVENIALKPGPFQASITTVISPNMIIGQFHQSKGCFQKGYAAAGYFAFLIWEPGVPFSWHHQELDKGVVPVVWGIEHLSLIGDGFRGYPISIREEFFIEECKRRGLTHLAKSFGANALYDVPEEKIQRLRDEVKRLAGAEQPLDPRALEEKILKLLFDCFESYELRKVKNDYRELYALVEHIMDNREHPVSLNTYYEANGLSPRTLRHQFQSVYGMPPKQFLKAVRLNYLHGELRARAQEVSIMVVAKRCGFNHLGQMAKDFKALFGILPREVQANG